MNLIYDDHMIIRYGQHHMTIYDGHPKMKQSVEKNICKITFEIFFRILFGRSCFDCLDSKSFLKHIVENLKIHRQIFLCSETTRTILELLQIVANKKRFV